MENREVEVDARLTGSSSEDNADQLVDEYSKMDFLSLLLVGQGERVPDGTILAIHHYWTGLIIGLYSVWHVSDDYPHREPSIVLGGILTAVLGFLAWQHHPVAGAILSHVGLLAIAGAVVIGDFMSRYCWRGFRGVVLVGLLISLDDLLSHAWGIRIPLDGWELWHYPIEVFTPGPICYQDDTLLDLLIPMFVIRTYNDLRSG